MDFNALDMLTNDVKSSDSSDYETGDESEESKENGLSTESDPAAERSLFSESKMEKEEEEQEEVKKEVQDDPVKLNMKETKAHHQTNFLNISPIFSRRREGGGRKYNVVALISGGKDSIFNCMHCVRRGHHLLALANVAPSRKLQTRQILHEKEDLSSFMYQTVGHELIEAIAECMELPLVRRYTECRARTEALQYEKTEGDEVEDLYELLVDVKRRFPEINAVAVGAVFSTYQRTRVENVCARLQMKCLCFLWQRNQRRLLKDMVDCALDAVLVKVACLGLNRDHVGKTIAAMEEQLLDLNEKFDVHPCGEGGEYETLTLDCPLYRRKRIVLDRTRIVEHSDDGVAPVLSLVVDAFHVETKNVEESTDSDRMHPPEDFLQMGIVLNDSQSKPFKKHDGVCDTSARPGEFVFVPLTFAPWRVEHRTGESPKMNVKTEAALAIGELRRRLEARNVSTDDVLRVRLYLSDLGDFAAVNQVFCEVFGGGKSPFVPSRSCVQIHGLPHGARICLSCVARAGSSSTDSERRMLWVRSISAWAPTNIGPYSQANTCQLGSTKVALLAGQIGLDGASMTLVRGGWGSELMQSISNCRAVLNAVFESNVYCAMHCTVFVSWGDVGTRNDAEACSRQRRLAISAIRRLCVDFLGPSRGDSTWTNDESPVLIVAVPELPRAAAIEIEVTACNSCRRVTFTHHDASVSVSFVQGVAMVAQATLSSLGDEEESSIDDSVLRGSLLSAIVSAIETSKINMSRASTRLTVYYVNGDSSKSSSDVPSKNGLKSADDQIGVTISAIVHNYFAQTFRGARFVVDCVPVLGLEEHMPLAVHVFVIDDLVGQTKSTAHDDEEEEEEGAGNTATTRVGCEGFIGCLSLNAPSVGESTSA